MAVILAGSVAVTSVARAEAAAREAALPEVPAGFVVNLFARLEEPPTTIAVAPNGDLYVATFAGNVEGRDLMTDEADVVVTDGFTGNVALKTLEGGLKTLVASLLAAFDSSDEAREASAALWPVLGPLYDTLDPESTGGAMLLGVDGVCIISHGSSSSRAMVNAIAVAKEMVERDLVGSLRSAIRPE